MFTNRDENRKSRALDNHLTWNLEILDRDQIESIANLIRSENMLAEDIENIINKFSTNSENLNYIRLTYLQLALQHHDYETIPDESRLALCNKINEVLYPQRYANTNSNCVIS